MNDWLFVYQDFKFKGSEVEVYTVITDSNYYPGFCTLTATTSKMELGHTLTLQIGGSFNSSQPSFRGVATKLRYYPGYSTNSFVTIWNMVQPGWASKPAY